MVTKTTIAETLKEVMAKKDIKLTVAESNLCVTTVFQAVKNALVNAGEVRIDGFGTFKSVDKPERTGRNPRTGESITIAAHKDVVFKAAKALKMTVNNK
uniref:HU family DNA-binding protein n=1 Tax=Prevotella sp. TaxID=59823 RepID=UPI0040270076